ncbi:MAG: cytochrome c [Gammaproteobacteria bacterium]|nr:cytochrome c [Gammaproteobacteria bacterium]
MKRLLLTAALALLGVVSGTVELQAQGAAGEVTFSRDVAPILQANCQECHRPGGIGPMSLLTYQDARPWAPMIKTQVETRTMPPWHVDRTIGIQEYQNDLSLLDEEIQTIVAWVDGGAPEGDPADLPSAVAWPDGASWLLEDELGRPPDLVFRSPGFDVENTGLDQWFEPDVLLTELDRPRWIRATESRPSLHSREVTHHGNTTISKFGGPGTPFDLYPDGSGLLVEPGQRVTFNLHYFPRGHSVEGAYAEVGLWFYPEDYEPEYKLTAATRVFSSYKNLDIGQQTMLIAPHSRGITQAFHVLEDPSWIWSIRGHQHLRGTGQTLEAIYPDGRKEVLTKFNWLHAWSLTYIYDDHAQPLLPKGTVLVLTSYYDNTADNPSNPDPDQWVVHGRRTGDEMSHIHLQIVSLDQEDYDQRVAERARTLSGREPAAGG